MAATCAGCASTDKLPSIASIAVCASKLQHYGDRLPQTGMHDELLSSASLSSARLAIEQINERATSQMGNAPEMGPAA
jgi:hypothetical protein